MRRLALILFGLLLCATPSFADGQSDSDHSITIEKIECEGNRHTTCEFIVGQTELDEGQKLNEEKVKEAKLRLALLGYYEEVTIRLEKGSEFGRAKLVISLKERGPLSFYGSFGVTSPIDSPFFTTDVIGSHRSLTGKGDPLSLRLRTNFGTTYYDTSLEQNNLLRSSTNASRALELTGRVEYTRPNLFNSKFSITGGIGAGKLNNRHYQSAVGDTDYSFWWTDLSLGYRVTTQSFVSTGYRYAQENWEQVLSAPYPKATYSDKPHTLFAQYVWDSQDDPVFPTSGMRVQLGVEYSPKEGRFHFTRLNFLNHWQFGKNVITARVGELFPSDLNFLDQNMVSRGNSVISFRYTNIFRRYQAQNFISDAAWYFEPGLFVSPRAVGGGLRLGTTMQTSLGTINLFVLFAGLGNQE